jgi:hypothetical protein
LAIGLDKLPAKDGSDPEEYTKIHLFHENTQPEIALWSLWLVLVDMCPST